MKKTEKILAKIKEKSSKKLDKSYALIEFENYESKQKALLTELRVFGLQISGNMCFTDDADYKLTLMCNNVHWGASLEKFCDFLNEKLKEAKHSGNIIYLQFFNHLLDLKIEIQPKDYKKIITKYYLIIRFNNFSNTLKAMRALRNTVFEVTI